MNNDTSINVSVNDKIHIKTKVLDNLINASIKSGVSVRSLIFQDTTENWNANIDYIPPKNSIIVYTDHRTIIEDGVEIKIPGLKVGDGNAYLIDLPFIDSYMDKEVSEHIVDSVIHVSDEEREFWNNKVRCFLGEEENEENLIFTTL